MNVLTIIEANGRIPALIDQTSPSGAPQRVFEGAAIQLYLTTLYDPSHNLSFPPSTPDYFECLSWLIWAQSNLGPMQGQANHFYRYAPPPKIPYAVERYQNETRRCFGVLEGRLAEEQKQAGQQEGAGGPWLVGGKFSIADICSFSWVNWAEWAGVSTEKFPLVTDWVARIEKRPAVQRGLDVPEKFEMKEAMKSKEGEEAYAKHHSGWVMKGMEEEKEKHK